MNCSKCNGTGKVIWAHIANGRCFDCGGSGHTARSHAGVQKVVQHDPAQERQAFINRFAAAIRTVKSGGVRALDALRDDNCPDLGTELDDVHAWLHSARCPADVRDRAIAALAGLGVAV